MRYRKRLWIENATYHTMSRCMYAADLMKEDFVKDLLVEVIDMTLKKYDFEINSYAIVDNHFHFVIKTRRDGANISRIMQYIKARFAERYNRITGKFGPFWHDRFKDKIVELSDDPEFYLLWLLWYLAYNPVRKKAVADPRNYKYSTINAYLDEDYRPPIPITLHQTFLNLGSTFAERVKRFLGYEEIYRKRLAFIS